MNETLSELLESLGLTEEPYGIFYTDIEPTEGFVPTVGQPLSQELERQGKIDFQEVFKNFSCVLGKLWLARRFFTDIRPRPAPARFCVFKPISHFSTGEQPELVTFFARGEVLAGLCNLAAFVTDDFEIVATPFGAGCSFMVTWPLHYLARGRPRAVLGCGDPSARKYMKPDEMSFTVPYVLYEAFLARWRDTFLETDTWKVVKKKIDKSKEAWGEQA